MKAQPSLKQLMLVFTTVSEPMKRVIAKHASHDQSAHGKRYGAGGLFTRQQAAEANYIGYSDEMSPTVFDVAERGIEEHGWTAQGISDALATLGGEFYRMDTKGIRAAADSGDDTRAAQLLVDGLIANWNGNTASAETSFIVENARQTFERMGLDLGESLPDPYSAASRPERERWMSDEAAPARQLFQQVIETQYDAMQEHLIANGITEVRAFRGIHYASPSAQFPDKKGQVDVDERALSSWSIDYDIARQFARRGVWGNFAEADYDSAIIHDIIPAERIFSINTQHGLFGAFGVDRESEVVVIGSRRPVDYVVAGPGESMPQNQTAFDNIVLSKAKGVVILDADERNANWLRNRQ